jgi:hypothetical protein
VAAIILIMAADLAGFFSIPGPATVLSDFLWKTGLCRE